MNPLWGPGTKFIFNLLIVQTRIFFARKQLPFFSLRLFLRRVIVPIGRSVLLSLLAILPFFLRADKFGIGRFGLSAYSLLACIIIVFITGLDNNERTTTLKYIRNLTTRLSGKFAFTSISHKNDPS